MQKGIIVIFLVLFGDNVYSAERYTLEECLRIGQERSLSIQNARRDEAIAEETIRDVRANLLPQLQLTGNYTRLDEGPLYYEDLRGGEDLYGAGAEVSQLIYSGGSVRAALQAASAFRTSTAEETRALEERLTRDIRRSFFNLLYLKARVDVAGESVRQLEEFVQQTKALLANAAASEFDLLSAQVKLANENPRLVQAQNNLAVGKAQFKKLLYLESEDFELDGELTYFPLEAEYATLATTALAKRSDLLKAEQLVTMRTADVRVSKGSYLPQINAFANYRGDNPPASDPMSSDWDWGWNAGLTAKWNLFDGGHRSSEIRTKALRLEQARASYTDLQQLVLLEVRQAYLTAANALQVIDGTKGNVALAERALAIAKVRNENGLSTYLEFTDANLALSESRLIYFQSINAYLQALAEIRYACGTSDIPFTKRSSWKTKFNNP